MTFSEARARLHEYIDHAGEKEVMDLLSFVDMGKEKETIYDEATLNMLRERRESYISGKMPTYSLDESMQRVSNSRKI